MHTRYDTIDLISDKVLNQEIEFLLFLIHRLDSSKCFPIKKSIPEDLQTKIINYFGAGLSHTK